MGTQTHLESQNPIGKPSSKTAKLNPSFLHKFCFKIFKQTRLSQQLQQIKVFLCATCLFVCFLMEGKGKDKVLNIRPC